MIKNFNPNHIFPKKYTLNRCVFTWSCFWDLLPTSRIQINKINFKKIKMF